MHSPNLYSPAVGASVGVAEGRCVGAVVGAAVGAHDTGVGIVGSEQQVFIKCSTLSHPLRATVDDEAL
jgi:hypothetical protein